MIEPALAVIVAVPMPAPVASPVPLTVAKLVSEEDQVTLPVMSCWLLSEYVPVAVNCCVPLTNMDGPAGVTAIETSAGLTVRLCGY